MVNYPDVFSYVKAEEAGFTLPVDILGWQWSMTEHIKKSFFYKNGRQMTGNSTLKPVKNITRPILNLQYRTEDIDVKDIVFYIEDAGKMHLSFLIKKYHDDVFVKENDLDAFIDQYNESRIDYGLGLAKDTNQPKPDIVPLQTLAFCDQTDILSGPICIKHFYSPDQLEDMTKNGWFSEDNGADITADELITLSSQTPGQKQSPQGTEIKTPGRYIEVYELYGTLPTEYLTDKETEENKYTPQMQIISFYNKQDGEKQGVTIFKKKYKTVQEVFKTSLRDQIFGRACGFGGAEELFENQKWVNYDMIRMKDLLDSASKMLFKTTDAGVSSRNNLKNLDNMEVIELMEGTDISQVDTFPRNISIFDNSMTNWEAHAQMMGAANDSIMGKNPNSGTPFKLQELVTNESRGLHDFRKGKFAKDLESVYRDWILPKIVKEIIKGHKFLTTLDLDEMEAVSKQVAENQVNKIITDKILSGEEIFEDEMESLRESIKTEFSKDNRKLVEILKDEFKGLTIKIGINIAGKQAYLADRVDKLVNFFRQIASNPAVLDDPRMAKLANQILESSGLSPINFGALKLPEKQQTQPMAQGAMPAEQPMI